MTIEAAFSLAKDCNSAGRLNEAEAVCRSILQHTPNHADALHLLGATLYQLGRYLDSAQAFSRCVELNPDDEFAWNDLGAALYTAGQYPDAIRAFRKALGIQPNFQEAVTNLAEGLRVTGEYAQAASILWDVVAADPNCVDALNTLGASLTELGRMDEAVQMLKNALAVDPNFAPAINNLAVAQWAQGALDAAAASYQRVLRLRPNWSMGRYSLGCVQLLQGDFQQGFPNYEHRRDAHELGQVFRKFTQPRWKGEPLDGKRILVHVEQGFGDMIQFVRYVPMVRARGARVILQCQPELSRLFQRIEGIDELLLDGDLTNFDVECPLLSLPYTLKTTLHTIPGTVPYLRPDPSLVSFWRQRLRSWEGQLKVGLVWSGRAAPDPLRSVPPDSLSQLGELPGISFFSLQKHDPSRKFGIVSPNLDLIDWTQDLKDFADTAALIENLDFVITIDTAVAHLAGALGKRAFVLLKHVPDWRWQLHGTESPWYPTLRLFRQLSPGDWKTPIHDLSETLRPISRAAVASL